MTFSVCPSHLPHYYMEEKGIIFLSSYFTKAGGLSFAINRTHSLHLQGTLTSVI